MKRFALVWNSPGLVFFGLFCGFFVLFNVQAAERTLQLDIVNGANVSLDERVSITQGDQVTLLCTADSQVQIHLHGYDIEKTIIPGAITSIRFDAHATGRFPVTLHGPDHVEDDEEDHAHDHEHDKPVQKHDEQTLFYLEVYPD